MVKNMPELKVRFTRGKDKKDVLAVVREDGSQSWQHQQPGIPVHDLTHFAVESTLQLKNGFYGLLAQGWDITRLTDRDVRASLPREGLWTEFVVGLVQTERLAPEPLSALEFNNLLNKEKQNSGLQYDRELTDEELSRIRQTFLDLYLRWRLLKPGESLSLEFDKS
jgi:hypothetical protein